ncbi:MAG: DUF1287 domain-containing protein [Rhizobiales bacterium]|nr:DUF1287 domain-containing protein [Hyphomicrobiales bacterium]
MIKRRVFLTALLGLGAAGGAPHSPAGGIFANSEPWGAKLIAAAENQIGKTLWYDGAYVPLSYPGGDVPIERGVCTDVVIRAFRDGLGIDLQELVHEDMRRAFASYPRIWGLEKPDSNIDHRRVPNLQVFFSRRKASLPVSSDASLYLPGDVVTMTVAGGRPHIALVTHRASNDGLRPLCVHNIGAGARLEDILFAFDLTGHYRFRQ